MQLSSLRFAMLCAPLLLLTACGDGWETYRTTEVTPYGNSRTAGSTVVYVRAKMMPKKELKLEPAALDAEEIFIKSQEKGVAPPPPAALEAPVEVPAAVNDQGASLQMEHKTEEDVAVEHDANTLLDTQPVPQEEKAAEVAPKPSEEPSDGDSLSSGSTYYFTDDGDLSKVETQAGDEVNSKRSEGYALPGGATSLEQIYSDTF